MYAVYILYVYTLSLRVLRCIYSICTFKVAGRLPSEIVAVCVCVLGAFNAKHEGIEQSVQREQVSSRMRVYMHQRAIYPICAPRRIEKFKKSSPPPSCIFLKERRLFSLRI